MYGKHKNQFLLLRITLWEGGGAMEENFRTIPVQISDIKSNIAS